MLERIVSTTARDFSMSPRRLCSKYEEYTEECMIGDRDERQCLNRGLMDDTLEVMCALSFFCTTLQLKVLGSKRREELFFLIEITRVKHTSVCFSFL